MSENYFILTFVDDELYLLIKIIDHYSTIHHDRLNSWESETLFEIYSRIYSRLGGK